MKTNKFFKGLSLLFALLLLVGVAGSSLEASFAAKVKSKATNVATATTVTKTVSKVWEDDNNAAGMRPDSVQIQLMSNGVAYGDPVTLNEANNWSYTWISLPSGTTYTVEELAVDHYVPAYSNSVLGLSSSYRIITPGNKVTFNMEDLNYSSYIVAKKGNNFLVWTMGELNPAQQVEFLDQLHALPNLNASYPNTTMKNTVFMSGLEFSYKGININVTSEYEGTFYFDEKSDWSHFLIGQHDDQITVTNTYTEPPAPETKDVTAKKIWIDEPGTAPIHPNIYFQLYRMVPDGDPEAVEMPRLLTDGVTEVTWTDQPIMNPEGIEYVYWVVETDENGDYHIPEGYQDVSEDELIMINQYVIPE